MALPEREWYPISTLAGKWKVTEEDVEHYLETKKLSASIRLQPTMLDIMEIGEGYDDDKEESFDLPSGYPELLEGIFEIENYEKIVWDNDNTCDFKYNNIRLSKGEIVNGTNCIEEYEFVESYIVNKHNISITKNAIDSFIAVCNYDLSLPVGLEQPRLKSIIPPYLDPDNVFFSPTLETVVSAWLAVYDSGNFKNKAGHIKHITDWIEKNRRNKYDLKPTTIEYLAKVVNSHKTGGAPSTDSDKE